MPKNQSVDYAGLDENTLISLASNDERAFSELVSRYIYIVEIKARAYGRTKEEIDDLSQEGLEGFISAVRTFDAQSGVKLSTYANACITNKMLTVLKKQNRISLNETAGGSAEGAFFQLAESPESIVLEKEKYLEIVNEISSSLTEREWAVFTAFLEGKTYNQIAEELELSQKAVDNAMQRVRKKLKSVITC